MINLQVSRRDAGRLLTGVSDRRRKLERGVGKFAGPEWDDEKGQNMTDALDAYRSLERQLKEQIHGEDDHSRRARRDTSEYERRRDAPGDYRPKGGQA